MKTAGQDFDSLSAEARLEVDRVLAGELRIAPGYANLTDEAAVYLLMTTHGMGEVDARFMLTMGRGGLPFEELDEQGSLVRIVY